MESAKQCDSDGTIEKSPHNPNSSNTWNETGENSNGNPRNPRKRKNVTESENSEHLSSEKTLLVPKRENNTSLSADADQQSTDLYGLKQEFIESLGINLPLSKWVYVLNFRCDRTELKEVFELAGHVVICSVVAIRDRYANIMFSHPLEAVQAVSMFNGQILYGMKLKVAMMNTPSDTIILPKGLKDVGPGLGFNGRPLRDIVKHYEKYTKHQLSLVDASLFRRQNDIVEDGKELQESKSIDLDVKSKDSKESGITTTRRKFFKITNVEDLPRKEVINDTSITENQNKKPRCDEQDEESSSEEESPDARIVSNFSAKMKENNKIPEIVTVSKDSQLGVSSIQPIRVNIRSLDVGFKNRGPKTYQPPFPQPSNLQFQPNLPLGNTGPSVPIGPTGQVIPFHPSGTTMAPVRTNAPMMAPVCPNRPMMAPVSGSIGTFGPSNGTVGPPARVMNPIGSPGPFGSFGPQGSNISQNMQGPGVSLHPMNYGNVAISTGPHQPMPNNDVITLHFRNLPPSTTFPLLSEKMSQCGQVLSLQLTTPGCAVARFAHRLHAERCFQIFHGKCIDGCVIEVRFA